MGLYTAIISDLHLCEAEPVHPKHPLWKKFKTRQFFFDDIFCNFLKHIQEKANNNPIELVLNGDIFDFDSVTSAPEAPVFRVSLLERKRGLFPRPERSFYKINRILQDHHIWVKGLREFILKGNQVVFVIGNHDLELHFTEVQQEIIHNLSLPSKFVGNVRFADWFYISNKDTLIEHGNQYDAYCTCEDPINPFIQGYNFKAIRLPFGNLATRYIMNGLGFFNPHIDSNYIMTLPQYIRFFVKYMMRAQPELILTWLMGSIITLWRTVVDRMAVPVRDPLKIEDRVNAIALRSNATPRMVREMKELFVPPASSDPTLIARELWLDRTFIIFITFFIIFQAMLWVKQVFDVSFFWAFIPLFLLLPFFMFYSKSITSLVSSYKEPDERILSTAAAITNVKRIVFGHTHKALHEIIGPVEHLNSGTWSPAFRDVECTLAGGHKTFVWIVPDGENRQSTLRSFDGESSSEFIATNRNIKK